MKQRRRHSRSRGAAMVEFLAVVPVIILMFWGIDYFRSSYVRRLNVLNKSQTMAWRSASSNDGSCYKNKNETWSDRGDDTDPTKTGGNDSRDASIRYSGKTGSSLFKYAHVETNADAKTKQAKWQNNAVGTVRGGTYILCNEVVPSKTADGDVFGLLSDFAKNFF